MRFCSLSAVAVLATTLYAPTRGVAQSAPVPTVSSVSPTIVTAGEPLTLTGTSLMPPIGWTVVLRGVARYGGGPITSSLTSQSLTQLRFNAPAASETPMRLIYQPPLNDSLGNRNAISVHKREPQLPTPVVVQGPPSITWSGPTVAADLGTPFALFSLQGGQATIKGRWLRKSAPATVTFNGAPLAVVAHSYEPTGVLTALSGSGGGADRLVFAAPGTPGTGWLVVSHALGRDSAMLTMALPPVVSEVRVQDGATTRVVTAAQGLQRGMTYILRGQHLSLARTINGTVSLKRGVPRLGSTDLVPQYASDTNIVFTVPTTFVGTSAVLSVVTPIGTTTVGSFAIRNQVAAISVTAVTPTSLTIISGRDAELQATLDIPINTPPEALGTLRIALPAGATSALDLPVNGFPVEKGAPTKLKLRAGELQSATPFTMTVAHESNTLGGQPTATRSVAVTVRPPHPVRFRNTGPLTAGSNPQLDVVLDSATRPSSTLFALLSSANPNIVNVPASATMSRDLVPFTATVPPRTQPTSVSLSATVDGVTISQPFQVVLPVPQTVTASASTVKPYEEVLVTAVLNGTLATGEAAVFATSDTILKKLSSRNTGGVPGTDRPERNDPPNSVRYVTGRGLLEQRQVQVSVSYGGQTRSVSITAQPVLLSSFGASPASAVSGTALQATALLNVAPPTLIPSQDRYRLEFTSGDTTFASVDPLVLTAGLSNLVTIRLKGAPTTPRQVPITATLKTGGYIVSTKTTVVTVTP